jgi:hypothetical protein
MLAGEYVVFSDEKELSKQRKALENSQFREKIEALYKELALSEKLNHEIFFQAMVGHYNLKKLGLLKKKSLLTIINYCKPSTEKRMYILDLDSKLLIFLTLVAHGKKTGDNYSKHFSNKPGSLKSSLGFYITSDTYFGRHGYTLKLKGIEPKFNDNAEKRYIVVHGADYVSESFVERYGRLGRSWGCPAVPTDIAKEIIDLIKEGSCLFIYYNDKKYLKKSQYLNINTAVEQFLVESKNSNLLY